jgi:predicted Fe-Mo cluster-binding NifX family protein
MKVAVPLFKGRVAPVFDWAGNVLVVGAAEGPAVAADRQELELEGVAPQKRPAALGAAGVEVLICGGISTPLAAMIEGRGIRIIPGIVGDVEEVLDAYFQGGLDAARWAMPGWGACGRGPGPGRGCRRRGGGRAGRGRSRGRGGAGRGPGAP